MYCCAPNSEKYTPNIASNALINVINTASSSISEQIKNGDAPTILNSFISSLRWSIEDSNIALRPKVADTTTTMDIKHRLLIVIL